MAFWNRRKPKEKALSSVGDNGWVRIFDWTPHAWQSHDPYNPNSSSVLTNPIVFSCITLIQGDIGKMPFLVEQNQEKIWQSVDHPILKVLRKPNLYQNQLQFLKNWVLSKLLYGNTYVLKIREGNNIVGLCVLDPLKVTPLVSDFGEVFYQLTDDELSKIEGTKIVPATEIIHDRDNCLYHPLVGLSPLFAGLGAANIGNAIIKDSKGFFNNGAKPGGILTAPGAIGDETAKRLKEYWDSNFSGDNTGKVAVVGDGLTYAPMRMNSVDAQLIEQLGWSDEKICSVFHIPAYMVGVGDMPTYNNIEALTIQYYSQCLQELVASMEECLNAGLNLQGRFRIKLDTDSLFRMDQSTLTKMLNDGVGGGWMAPDEARQRVNLPPVPGGQYPYLQQQNYSLEALSQRDIKEPEPPPQEEVTEDQAMMLAYFLEKELNGEAART